MKRVSITLCTLMFLATPSGWADDLPAPQDPRAAHAATDRDHNGEIDREEFDQRIIQTFYFADADKDGFVTLGQLPVFDEERLFETADLDGDSRLSLSEFQAARAKNFREADADGSDTLSVQEVVDEFNR